MKKNNRYSFLFSQHQASRSLRKKTLQRTHAPAHASMEPKTDDVSHARVHDTRYSKRPKPEIDDALIINLANRLKNVEPERNVRVGNSDPNKKHYARDVPTEALYCNETLERAPNRCPILRDMTFAHALALGNSSLLSYLRHPLLLLDDDKIDLHDICALLSDGECNRLMDELLRVAGRA